MATAEEPVKRTLTTVGSVREKVQSLIDAEKESVEDLKAEVAAIEAKITAKVASMIAYNSVLAIMGKSGE